LRSFAQTFTAVSFAWICCWLAASVATTVDMRDLHVRLAEPAGCGPEILLETVGRPVGQPVGWSGSERGV
jgi:hypothetical protein